MEAKKEQKTTKKKVKKGCLISFVVFAFVFLLLMIIAVNSEDTSDKEQKTEAVEQEQKRPEELQEAMNKWYEKNREQFKQDSISLVNYIQEGIDQKSRKLITIGFDGFNNNDQCILQVGLPDNGWEGKDEVGKYICELAVKWFVENERDLEDADVSALVYSPRKGVSGRENWRIWGLAMYRYETDDIKWYNSDELVELFPDMLNFYEE